MSKFQAHKDAPDEVWLQIGYGDEGEHTWAPHEIADDGIEEAGPYVRADRLSGRVTVKPTSERHGDTVPASDQDARIASVRNDALEEAAKIAGKYHDQAAGDIRALKSEAT